MLTEPRGMHEVIMSCQCRGSSCLVVSSLLRSIIVVLSVSPKLVFALYRVSCIMDCLLFACRMSISIAWLGLANSPIDVCLRFVPNGEPPFLTRWWSLCTFPSLVWDTSWHLEARITASIARRPVPSSRQLCCRVWKDPAQFPRWPRLMATRQ